MPSTCSPEQTRGARACSRLIAAMFVQFSATWGLGETGKDWGLAAGRLGSHVLSHCSRWLIFVEGVGNNGGQCRRASTDYCWWKRIIQLLPAESRAI